MRRFNRTTLISIGCLSILVGLVLAQKFRFNPPDFILVVWPVLLFLKKRSILSAILVVLLGLSIGLWRGSIYENKLSELNSLANKPVSIEAQVTSDSIYGKNSQVQFTANKIYLVEPYNKKLSGNFKISGFGLKMVYRGDIVRASGKLYRTRGSNQASISYARLTKISDGNNLFASMSRSFTAGMQNALPEPLASFGLGLLVGLRSVMPQDVLNQLTTVGLVHIVAVSGYNLTILVRAVSRLKLNSKYQRLVLSLGLIAFFVLITGFSASIVRAAVVSILGLWAGYYGLKIKPLVLISFAAALTGFINPYYVWGDLSWYLSFLAFFGILIIGPTIQARLFSKEPKILTSVVIETLSAELMTLPVIMLSYGQLSLVSLLANVLIVPLLPIAMLLSAIAGFAGMLIPQLAGWLAWPAVLLLTYMLDIVHLMAGIPSALARVSISSSVLVGFYVILILVVITMRRRAKLKPNNIQTVLIK